MFFFQGCHITQPTLLSGRRVLPPDHLLPHTPTRPGTKMTWLRDFCAVPGRRTPESRFNFKGEKTGRFCGTHKQNGMDGGRVLRPLLRARCLRDAGEVQPTEQQGRSILGEHRIDGTMDVVQKQTQWGYRKRRSKLQPPEQHGWAVDYAGSTYYMEDGMVNNNVVNKQ